MALIAYDLNTGVSARLASVELIYPVSRSDGSASSFDYLTDYIPGVDNEIVVVKGSANVHRVLFNRFNESARLTKSSFSDVTAATLSFGEVSLSEGLGGRLINWAHGEGAIDFAFGLIMKDMEAGVYRPKLEVRSSFSLGSNYLLHPALREDFQVRLVDGV